MNKYMVGLIIAIVIGLLCLMALHLSVPAHAAVNVPGPVCGEGLHVGNPHCTPKPTPTASPTATPKPTPADCDHDGDLKDRFEAKECPKVTPTPTPSPTETPSPSETPAPTEPPVVTNNNPGGGDGKQADIVCSTPIDAAKLQGYSRDKETGDVTFSWWPSTDPSVVSQSIVFGYNEDNLNMGQNDLPKDQGSFTIHGLAPQMVWGQIWSYTSGGCKAESQKVDP